VPFTDLLAGESPSGAFKGVDELRDAFSHAGVDVDKPVVCTCGSGATAAVLSMALYMITGQLVSFTCSRLLAQLWCR
jgi:thiosulfate/3-mercaptopyruvate sulfurtransferase